MTTARVPAALVAAGRATATAAVMVVALVLCLVCSDHGHIGTADSSAASTSSASSDHDEGRDDCTTDTDCPTATARTSVAAPQASSPVEAAVRQPFPAIVTSAAVRVDEQPGSMNRSKRSQLGVWRI